MKRPHNRQLSSISPIAHSSEPFTQECMNEIFKVSAWDSNRLTSRECSWLEFKLSFNWGGKEAYAKSMSAFANTAGGYIVFGISNSPRRIIGLNNNNFEETDPAKISEYLNEVFSPEIDWQMHVHEFQGKTIGLIFTYEASNKPVIATRNGDREFKEGEIFYRYRGQTKKIRYPELRKILDDQRQKEQDYWIQHLGRIAKIGIKNAAIFDTESGIVTGSSGSFLIDEGVLPKLKFIKEGEFQETKGAPTLKLIGEVKPVNPGLIQPMRTLVKTRAIRTPDIIHAFLDQKKVSDPEEYIKQICFESSAFLPIYFFMRLANLTKGRTLEIIKNIQSRSPSQQKLIQRLESDEDLSLHLNTKSDATRKKKEYREQILKRSIDEEIQSDELKYVLQAIRTLRFSDIDKSYLYPLILNWFDTYYVSKQQNLVDELRRAICHLDKIVNYEEINDIRERSA